MAEDDEDKAKPINVRLAPATIAYLNDLARTGLYGGTNPTAVVRDLVVTGIRRAIDEGRIKQREF